jgi:hypothetical protein
MMRFNLEAVDQVFRFVGDGWEGRTKLGRLLVLADESGRVYLREFGRETAFEGSAVSLELLGAPADWYDLMRTEAEPVQGAGSVEAVSPPPASPVAAPVASLGSLLQSNLGWLANVPRVWGMRLPSQ